MENNLVPWKVHGSIYNGEVPVTCGKYVFNLIDFIQKVEQGDLPSLETCNGKCNFVKEGDEYFLNRPTYLCWECDNNTKRATRIMSLLLRQRNRPLKEEAQSTKTDPSEALCCAVDGSHLRPLAVAPALVSVTPENALSMLCMVLKTPDES